MTARWLLGCGLLLTYTAGAQYAPPAGLSRNVVYAEGLGAGVLYSLNYERLLRVGPQSAYGLRVGGSAYGPRAQTLALIGEAFVLLGGKSHHADLGLALTGLRGPGPEALPTAPSVRNALYAVPRLAYRYQEPGGGIMLRAGFTPLVKLIDCGCIQRVSPSLGLAIGYSF